MGSVDRTTDTLPFRVILGALIAILLTAMLSVSCACDVEEDASVQLSLAKAVSDALGENVQVKQQESSYQDALSGLRTSGFKTSFGWGTDARVDRWPGDSDVSGVVFGDVTYESFGGTQATVDFTPLGLGTERGAFGLTFRHPLMRGSGVLSSKADRVAGARSNVSVQDKQRFLTRQAKVVEAVRAYYQAVLSRDQVTVQERAVDNAETALRGAEARLREGMVAGIEAYRAKIQVSQTKDALNRVVKNGRDAMDRLMVAIGSGVGGTPVLTDAVPEVEPDVPDLAKAIETALANRGELFVFDQQISDQERKLALAADELRPSLYAVAGYSSMSSDRGLVTGSALRLGDFTAGFEMRFPVDRRSIREDRDIATRGLDILQQLRTYRMEQITEDVRQACRSVERSRKSLGILGDNLEDAQENLRLARLMVTEGVGSNRDVLDAQSALTRAESGLLAAKVDLYLATLDLEYSKGEDLTKIGLQ